MLSVVPGIEIWPVSGVVLDLQKFPSSRYTLPVVDQGSAVQLNNTYLKLTRCVPWIRALFPHYEEVLRTQTLQ